MSKLKTPQKRERAKLITQHEFVLVAHHMEKSSGESLTVPDETMTIREIMKKHVSGMRIKESLYRQGFYEDTDDFDSPDFSEIGRLDLSEQDELRESQKQKVENLTQKQKAAEAAKKEAAKNEEQKAVESKKERAKNEQATPKDDTAQSDEA